MAGGQLNTFLDDLFKYVPADKQAEVRAIYSKASDRATSLESAVEAVNTTAARQKEWWEANKDVVAERDRIAGELAAANKGGHVDQNAIQAALDKQRAEVMETGLGLMTAVSTIAGQHFAEFHEPLDMTQLTRDAIAAGKPLDQHYAGTVAERRKVKADEALNARLEAAKKEGADQARTELLQQMGKNGPPFPVGQTPAITTLSGLKKPADGSASPFSLDAAVATATAAMAAEMNR